MPHAERFNADTPEYDHTALMPALQQESLSMYQRYGRKLAAGALAVAAVVGVSGCSAVSSFSERAGSAIGQNDDTERAAAPQPEVITPITAAVPETIQRSFAAAVEAEGNADATCETPVTAEEVTSLYQRLFMTGERPGLSLEGLRTRTEEVSTGLTIARAELGMKPLPESYQMLREDADLERAIPLNAYEKTAQEYFAQFGVQALFAWEDRDFTDPGFDATISMIAHQAVPVTEQTPGENRIIRTRILGAMKAFSLIPPELLTDKPLKYIVFGDILNQEGHGSVDAAGLYSAMDDAIFVDTAPVFSSDGIYPSVESQGNVSIATHETAHKHDFDMCGLALAMSDKDPAMDALNDGFVYDAANKRSDEEIKAGLPIDGAYSTIMEGPANGQEIVALRDYGTVSPVESKAVDVGEVAMHGDIVLSLLSAEGDTARIEKRVAYQLARMNRTNPASVGYMVQLFDAARVRIAVDEAGAAAAEALNTYIHESFGSAMEITEDPKFQELQKAAQPYEELRARLAAAANDTL